MHLFVFLTGFLAKHNPKRLITRLIIPYFVFQFLYTLFHIYIVGNSLVQVRFTTPFWHLWFLMATIAWMLILPILDSLTDTLFKSWIVVGASFLLGLLAGFETTMGYYMSLQRIFYFLPFFVLGFVLKKHFDPEELIEFVKIPKVRIIFVSLCSLILILVFALTDHIYVRWLWAAFSYQSLAHEGYGLHVRLIIYICAVIISIAVISLIPNVKMFFSYIGEHSIRVFLLHGFIMAFMEIFRFDYAYYGLQMLFMTVFVTALTVFILPTRLFSLSFWIWLLVKRRSER